MIRLDKFLCETLGVTRKQASFLVKAQRVEINGQIQKSGALKLAESDVVTFDGAELHLSGSRYYMMNKPQGYVCSHEDANNPTVFVLFDEPFATKLHIAGRLDSDTTGLLLFTDDGQWSHRVTSPKHKCDKRYWVELADPISDDTEPQFAKGILLRNEKQPTLPAQLEKISETEAWLTIHEGKYHQVKRMFAAVGNKVIGLHRERIGRLELDDTLAEGEYRALTPQEVALFTRT